MASGNGFLGGLFNYSKPGKGVRKDEPERSRFVQFWVLVKRKFWKLIQLNLLYLLFCIPIVTIGPATAALTYILRLYTNEQPVFMLSDFWDAFKANWKQAFAHSVILAVVGFIVSTAIRFYNHNAAGQTWLYLLMGLSIMVAIVGLMANFYVSLMIVTLELKLRYIIKNAFLLAILCLKTNFITLFFAGLLVLVAYLFFPISVLLLLIIFFSFFNFVIVYNCWPGVNKFAIQPFLQKQEEEAAEEQVALVVEEDGQDTIFTDEYDVKSEDDKLDERKGITEEKKNKAADDFLGRK